MIFASDLDNTLIHSYKTAKYGDVCVEVKEGKQLSFMPPDGISLLRKIAERCIFVPVTTRSLEQYRRIDLSVSPPYALVSHGAILLTEGEVDGKWLQETQSLLGTRLPKLKDNELIYDIRYVNDFFIFAKSQKPLEAVDSLKTAVDTEKFNICAVSNKIYVFPNRLTKGLALERLKKRLSSEKIICAGDSLLDISMLKIADMAIAPKGLGISGNNTLLLDDCAFTRELLSAVSDLLK